MDPKVWQAGLIGAGASFLLMASVVGYAALVMGGAMPCGASGGSDADCGMNQVLALLWSTLAAYTAMAAGIAGATCLAAAAGLAWKQRRSVATLPPA